MSNKAINDGSKDAKVLCQVLKNARELKLDYQTLAADFGMTSTTNVARKITTAMKPYGFEFKSGKVVKIDTSCENAEDDASGTQTPKAGDYRSTNAGVPNTATKKTTRGQTKKGIAKVTSASKRKAPEKQDDIELQCVDKKSKKFDTMPPPFPWQRADGTLREEDKEIERLLLQEFEEDRDGDHEASGRTDSEATAIASGSSVKADEGHDEDELED